MSEPIKFTVTNAGKNALYSAQQTNVKLSLSKVGLGSGQYDAAANRVQMAAKFTDNGISAGSIEIDTFSLRFMMIMSFAVEKTVSELGLYTSTGVLFAVASKPNGSYFRLYPGIDYVAMFSLVLEETVNPALVEFVLDGRGTLALQMMEGHLNESDPHPQYKEYSRLALQGHLGEPDPHQQYALKTYVHSELDKVNRTVNKVVEVASLLFPPILMVGAAVGADTVAERIKGHTYSLINRSIVHLFCPEGTHEGWTCAREANVVKANVFERSGTNRIGYGGRVNWAMIDTERVMVQRGFIEPGNQLAQEVKSGVIEPWESLVILREANEAIDFTDPNLVLIVSPEGTHEGWEVTRTKDQISLNIFNRSGTNRIGYGGRVNWAIFRVNPNPDLNGAYPRQLITGYSNSADFVIPAPPGMDFTDTNFVPFLTPESGHEGWTITRTTGGFSVNVFNRSGQNRVGYNGRVNWAVFVGKRPVNRKVYFQGNHSIVVPAGRTAIIDLFGPGGGGGGSVYTPAYTPPNGTDAGNTRLAYGGAEFIAGGGKKGTGGAWGNGSSFSNGAPGAGGVNSVNGLTGAFRLLANVPGNPGIEGSRWERQKGGAPTSISSGLDVDNHGGLGSWGVGDENWSYGGGAGSGGYVKAEFTNTTGQDIALELTVGEAGKGWTTAGYHGDNGGPGFAVVSIEL